MSEKNVRGWKKLVSAFVDLEEDAKVPPAQELLTPPPSSAPPPPFMIPPASPAPFAAPPLAAVDEPRLSFEETATIATEVRGILGVESLPAIQAFHEAHETLAGAQGAMSPDERNKMAVMIALRMRGLEPQKMFADARAALNKLDGYRTTNRSSMPAELQAITAKAEQRGQELDQRATLLRRQIDQLQAELNAINDERGRLTSNAEQERLRCQLQHQAKDAMLGAQETLLQQISTIANDMMTKTSSRRTS